MTCWASTSSAPIARRVAVQRVLGDRLAGGLALQHLEAVGRHEEGAARARPAGGWRGRSAAPSARRPWARRAGSPGPRRPSRCRGPASRCRPRRAARPAPSPPRPCAAARPPGEPWCRAIGRLSSFSRHSSWKANSAWKRVLTKTSAVRDALDDVIDLLHGVLGGVAGPRHLALRQQHLDDRLGARRRRAPGRCCRCRLGRGRPSSALITSGSSTVADRPDAAQVRRELLQPGQVERQQVAALGGVQGVDLVEDHALQVLEIEPRALPGAEQGQLLGRGQQDVRRLHPLALAAREAGVAGAALGDDRQAHLGDRAPSGCARRRPPAPSAARCRGCAGRAACWPAAARPARSGWAGSRPGSCRRRSARSAGRRARPGPRSIIASWCARGLQPRSANQSANRGGRRSAAGPALSAILRPIACSRSVSSAGPLRQI